MSLSEVRIEAHVVPRATPVVGHVVDQIADGVGVVRFETGHVEVPGFVPDDSYIVRDLIDDVTYNWRGAWNYVRFDPDIRQGHILWLPTPRT